MTEKDYSLLRPFDLEAAKAGAKLFCINSENGETECTFIQKAGDELCIHFERFGFSIHDETDSLRMAPLCWVEGKPVYPGDVLERENWKAFIPDMVAISGELRMSGEGLPSYLKPEQLRWPRPKPVKRWINVYPGMYRDGGPCSTTMHSTKEAAEADLMHGSIACIEIELPPIKP